MTIQEMWPLIAEAFGETIYMTVPAMLLSYLIGLPLGILLVVTGKGHIRPMPTLNSVLGAIVNFLRSIPFIILMAMLIPVTRVVMGKAIGTRSVIFPLIISAFPYVARMVESSLLEVDRGAVEAAQSMGSSDWQVIFKVLLPEAVPALLNGAAITTTAVLSYTALASAVGGGGLGSLAITKGLNQRKYEIMYFASIALVVIVQIVTVLGTYLTRRSDHRKR